MNKIAELNKHEITAVSGGCGCCYYIIFSIIGCSLGLYAYLRKTQDQIKNEIKEMEKLYTQALETSETIDELYKTKDLPPMAKLILLMAQNNMRKQLPDKVTEEQGL